MHEGRELSDGKGNGGCPPGPIENAWDRGVVRERLTGGLSKPARGKESPKMGALPAARAVVSVMIQESRVDERIERREREKTRQRGGGGAEETAGEGGRAGVVECGRGPGIYARRSRAYARVFVYLCGTPENPVDERERDGRPREGEEEEEEEE